MNIFSSLAAPTKFVPLSLLMLFGWPRLAMNLATAAGHDLVSNDCVTLMFTALVVRLVKMQHHLFRVCCMKPTSKFPKKSTAVWVNGNTCS